MNVQNDHAVLKEKPADSAIDRWENEGGSQGRHSQGVQYGRRVETDRSWTIYHVFTGVPAHINGNMMIGLTRRIATDRMLSLNRCNEARGQEGGSATDAIRRPPHTAEERRR